MYVWCGLFRIIILLLILLQQPGDLSNQVGDEGMHSSTEFLSSTGEVEGERSRLCH